MQEHDTFPGKVYAITCASGCTITDNKGRTLGECEAGKQTLVVATSDKLLTSADALVTATFNFAPAKLRALGILGGGVSALPAGYLAAEFLESTGGAANCYIKTNILLNGQTEFECKYRCKDIASSAVFGAREAWRNKMFELCVDVNALQMRYGNDNPVTVIYNKPESDHIVSYIGPTILVNGQSFYRQRKDFVIPAPMCIFACGEPSAVVDSRIEGRLYYLNTNTDGEQHLFLPALNPNGVPCMFDKVSKQPFYNSGTGQFIVGLTLSQARKLGNLPVGGGTLKVSLPSNYLEDEGVVNAIAEANAKGWNIEVASTWDASGASATFALRRIWVRKTRAEQGNYVAADGTRWAVESCVAMYNVDGSEPDAHGYEPFRSVDAAVAYWELEPYVYPEEDLTEQ